jgi:P4 family phage/plasmid primase-like protien
VPPAASLLARLLDGCFRGDDDAAEKQALMAEIAGAAALGVATHLAAPKAVILCGPSAANGKSAINDMIRALLPADAVASISPAKLHDERFRIHLAGKLLNASDELGETAIFGEDFKAAVTGDPMTGKEVYKPAVQFRPRALQLLACNRFPAFEGGMDAGVRRRLLVIPFNRTIPEDERVECMGRRIGEEEGDILLAWAVAGASRLMKRRGFASLKSSQEALAEWILTTDPVGGWMRERLDVTGDPSHIVGTTQAYDCFRAWADREGIHKIKLPTRGQFTAQVASSGLKGIHVVRLNRGTVIRGARLLGPHPVGDAEVTPESRRFAG